MKFTTAASLLSLTGYAAAQGASSIPSCALSCFTNAVQDTSCSLLDFYCQCSTGAATIAKEALPCVCNNSDCTADEIAEVAKASYNICSAAYSSSSQTYTVKPLATNFCKSLSKGSGTASSSSTPAANSAKSTGSAASASSSSSSAASGNNAAAPTAHVGIQAGVIGAGALALLAL